MEMPSELTAENGAKKLLIGEFKIESYTECPECFDGDDWEDTCDLCEGNGQIRVDKDVPWTMIKEIYKAVVDGVESGHIDINK